MLIGAGLLMMAPVYGPVDTTAQKASTVKIVPDPCQSAKVEPEVIVVCGKREGYRIDADILQAQRQYRDRTKPRPSERFADSSCQVVGTMGCINAPSVNLLSAAMTAVTMVKKAVKSENIGKMFITDPTPSEYELYKAAKHEREEHEALADRKAEAAVRGAAGQTPHELGVQTHTAEK